MVLCDQWCKTEVRWDQSQGCWVNERDGKRHVCYIAERAREFEGFYNMIQINPLKPMIEDLEHALKSTELILNQLKARIEYVEKQNKPLAEAFRRRKAAGKDRWNK